MRVKRPGRWMRWVQRPGWLVRLGCVAGAVCCAAAGGGQSLFDHPVGFTAQQAQRGQVVYAQGCASCHGRHLIDGQFGPPVKGATFKAHWHDQPSQALWSVIVKRMPPASPGSLDSRAYTDVEAYLLQENGEKPGALELVASVVPSVPRTAGASRLDNEDAAYRAAMAARKA